MIGLVMPRSILLLSVLALTSCGEDVAGACQKYHDAYNQCLSDYGDAIGRDFSSTLLEDGYCDDTYGDLHDADSAGRLDCLAGKYNDADCSDPAAYSAIDLADCTVE